MDAEVIRKLVPTEFYTEFFRQGLRPDDREVMQARKIAINFGKDYWKMRAQTTLSP